MFKKNLVRNVLTLVIITIVAIAALLIVYKLMQKRISNADQNYLRQTIVGLGKAFPTSLYDNDLLKSCYEPKPGKFNTDPTVDKLLIARKGDQIAGYILISSTLHGYNGEIKTMLVTDPQGVIKAVRVLFQQETPGLGSKVVTTNWVHEFDDLDLQTADTTAFYVKKDGGKIDQFTGATITPRAITNAIRLNMQLVIKALVHNEPQTLAQDFLTCAAADQATGADHGN